MLIKFEFIRLYDVEGSIISVGIEGEGLLINLCKDRLKAQRETQLRQKEVVLNKLSDDEIVTQLKAKGLPVYGTKQEKLDRMKKNAGIPEPYINPDQPEIKKA